jgi:hypothetical protein
VARSNNSFALGKPATRLCPECGSKFIRTLVPFEFKGKPFGFFPADVCENGHEYFSQESRLRIQEIAKALGLWGSSKIPTLPPDTREVPVPGIDVILEESAQSTSAPTMTLAFRQGVIKKKLVLASA